MRRDPCAACRLPVFLAEKLLIARTPYHRTCFRCARCGNQLTPGNYYETEEGQYCCETCPDEEESSTGARRKYTDSIMDEAVKAGREVADEVSTRSSLSDEEKTGRKVRSRFAALCLLPFGLFAIYDRWTGNGRKIATFLPR